MFYANVQKAENELKSQGWDVEQIDIYDDCLHMTIQKHGQTIEKTIGHLPGEDSQWAETDGRGNIPESNTKDLQLLVREFDDDLIADKHVHKVSGPINDEWPMLARLIEKSGFEYHGIDKLREDIRGLLKGRGLCGHRLAGCLNLKFEHFSEDKVEFRIILPKTLSVTCTITIGYIELSTKPRNSCCTDDNVDPLLALAAERGIEF